MSWSETRTRIERPLSTLVQPSKHQLISGISSSSFYKMDQIQRAPFWFRLTYTFFLAWSLSLFGLTPKLGHCLTLIGSLFLDSVAQVFFGYKNWTDLAQHVMEEDGQLNFTFLPFIATFYCLYKACGILFARLWPPVIRRGEHCLQRVLSNSLVQGVLGFLTWSFTLIVSGAFFAFQLYYVYTNVFLVFRNKYGARART